jgi:hypothetical protein
LKRDKTFTKGSRTKIKNLKKKDQKRNVNNQEDQFAQFRGREKTRKKKPRQTTPATDMRRMWWYF